MKKKSLSAIAISHRCTASKRTSGFTRSTAVAVMSVVWCRSVIEVKRGVTLFCARASLACMRMNSKDWRDGRRSAMGHSRRVVGRGAFYLND